MSVIERVVKSAGEPGKTDLWLKEKDTDLQLCAYHNGQWVPISGGGGDSSVSWGTESDYTVPLTVDGVSKTICLDGYAGGGGDCPCKEVYFDAELIDDDGLLFPPYPSGAGGIQMAKNVLSEISDGTNLYNMGLHLTGEINGTEIEEYAKFSTSQTVKSGDDIIVKTYGATLGGEMQYSLPISYNSEQLDILLDLNEQLEGDSYGRVIFVNPTVGVSLSADPNSYLTCNLCDEDAAWQSTSYAYVVDESGHCYEVSGEYVMNYQDYGIIRITNISKTQYTELDHKTLTLPYSDVTKFIGTYTTVQGIG